MTGVLTKPIELTIIVPVLNEVKLLADFIEQLKQQWSHPQELLIIDGRQYRRQLGMAADSF